MPEPHLTPAERRVLDRLVLGESVGEIARALHLTPDTVKTHLHNLYARHDVHTAHGLVAWAYRHGIYH